MPHLSDEDFNAIEKELCERSFSAFVKRAWHIVEPHTTLVWGWHLDAICDHLQAVTEGKINRLLINVPPGSMKSLLTAVFWPAWEWGPAKRPEIRIVGTAHERGLAIRDNRRMRLVVTSEWYTERWPLGLSTDQNQSLYFENDSLGFRQAVAFATMTGKRGDRVILDDPLSAEDANSDIERENAARAFKETLPNRINHPTKSAIVVIMQRLHTRDISGIILDKKLPYTHLRIPMEYEPEDPCVTEIGWRDPRKKPFELMHPQLYDKDAVSAMRTSMTAYSFAGQYQQRPVPREGGLFNIGNIEIIDALPNGCTFVRGWDLAASTKKRSDFTAGVKLARTADGAYIIADVRKARFSAHKVRLLLRGTATLDGRETTIDYPQDPGAAGKGNAEDLAKYLAGFVFYYSTETGDKYSRAEPLAAQVEAGNVKMLRGSWNQGLLDEMANFPAGEFDDQVDAASRAFSRLAKGVRVEPKRIAVGY